MVESLKRKLSINTEMADMDTLLKIVGYALQNDDYDRALHVVESAQEVLIYLRGKICAASGMLNMPVITPKLPITTPICECQP